MQAQTLANIRVKSATGNEASGVAHQTKCWCHCEAEYLTVCAYLTNGRADCTSWSVGVGVPLMARKLRWRCEGLTFESCIGPYTKEVSLRFIW